MDLFSRPISDYKRNLNIVNTAIRDSAKYLHTMTNEPMERCIEYVKQTISPTGSHPLKNPNTLILKRQKNGDKQLMNVGLLQHLREISDNHLLVSPSMTTYLPPEKHGSLLSKYIRHNIAKRKVEKKAMFQALANGDSKLAETKDILQLIAKIKNNAISGAHCSAYTPLYNLSAHPSLTSTCRITTAYSNANVERFSEGNRHYYNAKIVTANIISIINNTDYDAVANAVKQFDLHVPTPDEMLMLIRRSTDNYAVTPDELRRIHRLAKNLTDLERVAFCYTGDFYHLAKWNHSLCHQFMDKLSSKITELPFDYSSDQPFDFADEDILILAKIINGNDIAGIPFKDVKDKRPAAYRAVIATYLNIVDQLTFFKPIIDTFWMTDNVPPVIANYPSSIRRAVVAGDTDSTIFTTQSWIRWFNQSDQVTFKDQDIAIGACMTLLISKTLSSILLKFSTQIGCNEKDRTILKMKNEYSFQVMFGTSIAKNYASQIVAREGDVYLEPELEIKGSTLRGSNTPLVVRNQLNGLIESSMETIKSGKRLNLNEVLKQVGELERRLMDNMVSGKLDYLKTVELKDEGSYKNPWSNNYIYYDLWKKVFAPKYGSSAEPPYLSVKISMNLDKPGKVKSWLANMADQELAFRMTQWMKERNKYKFTQMLLPTEIISKLGIPQEIIDGSGVRGVVYDTLKPIYLILESYGYYTINKDKTRLISDNY